MEESGSLVAVPSPCHPPRWNLGEIVTPEPPSEPHTTARLTGNRVLLLAQEQIPPRQIGMLVLPVHGLVCCPFAGYSPRAATRQVPQSLMINYNIATRRFPCIACKSIIAADL